MSRAEPGILQAANHHQTANADTFADHSNSQNGNS